MINYKNNCIKIVSATIMALTVFSACKKYTNPPQVFEEYGDNSEIKSDRRILLINVDGVVGEELLKINPTNIAELVKTGKFTFKELVDASAPSTPATWATMITGVSSSKHKISDESYKMTFDSNTEEHGAIVNYPTIFARLLDVRPDFKSVVATPDEKLRQYLRHADHVTKSATDADVKDSIVNVLKNGNDSKIFLADFRDVESTGKTVGFSADIQGYKDIIVKTDDYIGEIIAALKQRKNYAKEDWLVIVTTNRGGSDTSPKPGFIICSNPKLKSQELSKVGFNTMHFQGPKVTAIVAKDNGLYDAGSNKDFTVQIQVKFNRPATYPGFFSKSTNINGHANTGWAMIFNGGNWNVSIGGKQYGQGTSSLSGGQVADGRWHTFTLSVRTVSGVRTASVYTDGVKNSSANVTNINLTTTEPLKIGLRSQDNGYGGGDNSIDFYAADALYFNVGLDDATVLNNIALKDITQHPKYSNIIGYWPIDEGGGSTILNYAPVGYSFGMTGSGIWDALGNDIPVSRTPQELGKSGISIVNTGPDVSSLIFYWLRVPVKSDWGLDGTPWIQNFELEFLQ